MLEANAFVSEKKKALLAEKQRLLQEIEHCENLLEDARSNSKRTTFIDEDSSDSDTELTLMNSGLSVRQLNRNKSMLTTCIQATQELTGLEILEAETNIMVEDPLVDGQGPEGEAGGVWREVTSECLIDLVYFSIAFQAYRADRPFAPTRYRGLHVSLTRAQHAAELAMSVLSTLTRPSDAFEVLRSYAAAHRSRRTTLARLADTFAPALRMDPMPGGGYVVKCGTLLTVEWSLQNKWSPIAPFHHRLKFDLDYMDESYIKRITQVHRQLSDPEVDTKERTLLLSQIIGICLEARGPTQELHDSLSSDPECAQKMDRRRTTLDQEPEVPAMTKMNKDSEVMAPPKSVPKKSKKSKQSVADGKKSELMKKPGDNNAGIDKNLKTIETKQKSVKDGVSTANDAVGNTDKSVSSAKNATTKPKSKRSATENGKSEAVKITNEHNNLGGEKRLKTNDKANELNQQNANEIAEGTSVATAKNNEATDNTAGKNVVSSNNKAKIVKPVQKLANTNKKLKPVNTNTEKSSKSTKIPGKVMDKAVARITSKVKSITSKNNSIGSVASKNNIAECKDNAETMSVDSLDHMPAHTYTGKDVEKFKTSTPIIAKRVTKKPTSKIITKDGGKVVKKVVSDSNAAQKVVKTMKIVAGTNNTGLTKKLLDNNVARKINDKPSVSAPKEKVVNKNVASTQNSNNNKAPVDKIKKPTNGITNIKEPVNNNQKTKEHPLRTLNKHSNKPPITSNTNAKAGNTEKENNSGTKKIISKIPQKKPSQGMNKKVPLRISPRKPMPKPKMASQVSSNQKLEPTKKPATNIPRLASKHIPTETA